MTDGSHTKLGENMGNDTQKIKLLALWDILNNHTDEDYPMHTDEIIEALRENSLLSRTTAILHFGYYGRRYRRAYRDRR